MIFDQPLTQSVRHQSVSEKMRNTEQVDVVIIGGGISGLATAWHLNQAGASAVVLEKSPRCGGKIESVHRDGYLLEQSASMLANFRPEVEQFINAAGLTALKRHKQALSGENRYLLHHGQLLNVPTRLGGLLNCPLWSLRGKARLLLEPLIPKGGNSAETVADFIRRRLGSELLDTAMEPFIAGTLASDPEQANALTTLPRLTALEQEYGGILLGIIARRCSGIRLAMTSDIYSFAGGMQTLTQRLEEALRFNPQTFVHCHQQTITIQPSTSRNRGPSSQRWQIISGNSDNQIALEAKHIVFATPADACAQLLQDIDGDLAGLLSDIDYTHVAVVHLGFDRSAIRHRLNGSGFLIPGREGCAINGNLWMSSVFDDRAPCDKVLLSSYVGGCRNPAALACGDQRLVETVLAALRKPLQICAAPQMVHIKRQMRALPLYHGNYHRRCQQIKRALSAHAGLHICANYLDGISVRDRLLQAHSTASFIARQLSLADLSTTDQAGYDWGSIPPAINGRRQ